jgi:hypothetical protein
MRTVLLYKITENSGLEELRSCINLQDNTEIYNWNTEYSTITVIIIVISSTVHRLQDDPYWKCERCARAGCVASVLACVRACVRVW